MTSRGEPAASIVGVVTRAPERDFANVARMLVLMVGIGLSALFCIAAARSLGLAWPVTHPEGALIATVVRVRDGEPLYQDFRQPPYLIAPYPPLQPVVAGLLSRLLSLSTIETIALARGLTLTASLASTFLIWEIARAHGASRQAALAGASLLLPLPFLDEWGFGVRPDLPALALSLGALLVLYRQPDRPWQAAALAVLAFFTKQTAIALPVAATLWLILGGRWRAAIEFAATWILLAGVGIGLMELWTGGDYILNTVLALLNTPKHGFDLATRDIQPLFTDGWLPVGLAIIATVVLTVQRRRSLPALYFLVATVVALVTLRNTGSDVNYLIEPAGAACILAALAIGRVWGAEIRSARARWFQVISSVVLAGAAVVWGYPHFGYWRTDGGVQPIRRMPLQEIAAADSVLSEEPLAVILADKPLFVSDTFQISQLTSSGFFDPTDLERRIKRSEFDLIVLRSDVSAPRFWKHQYIFPEPLRQAIKDVYISAGRVGIYWLYKPEHRPSRR
jgi:hypothetical protein